MRPTTRTPRRVLGALALCAIACDGAVTTSGWNLPGLGGRARVAGRLGGDELPRPIERFVDASDGGTIRVDSRVAARCGGVRVRVYRIREGALYTAVLSRDAAVELPVIAGGRYRVEVTPVDHFAGEYDISAAGR